MSDREIRFFYQYNFQIKMEKYDFVIHGASGFTGQYVVEYVYRAAQEHGVYYFPILVFSIMFWLCRFSIIARSICG